MSRLKQYFNLCHMQFPFLRLNRLKQEKKSILKELCYENGLPGFKRVIYSRKVKVLQCCYNLTDRYFPFPLDLIFNSVSFPHSPPSSFASFRRPEFSCKLRTNTHFTNCTYSPFAPTVKRDHTSVVHILCKHPLCCAGVRLLLCHPDRP